MHTHILYDRLTAATQAPAAQARMPRRQFLSWVGLLGATALITACTNPGSASSTQASATEPAQAAVPQPTSTVTASPQSGTPSSSSPCVQRCPNSCSYPGRCRLYADGNRNGLCDRGECL